MRFVADRETRYRKTRPGKGPEERPEEIRARRLRELAALLEDIKAPRCPCAASQTR